MRTGSSGKAVLVMTFTVNGSTTSTRSMVAMLVRPGAACLRIQHPLTLNLTVGGVERLAVVELALRRSLNCHVVSLRDRQDSARIALELKRLEVAAE